jgi:hypothetical protein
MTPAPRLGAVALLLAALIAPAADAASCWVHKQGRYFAYWVPNDKWQAAEAANGIDVSSPTGLASVSFGYATNGPAPYTLAGVRSLLLSPQAGLTEVRLLSRGRTFSTGGGVSQTTSFIAVRIRDRAAVRGVVTAEVFNTSTYGSYGFAGYLQVAPAKEWKSWSPTLAAVKKQIRILGAG